MHQSQNLLHRPLFFSDSKRYFYSRESQDGSSKIVYNVPLSAVSRNATSAFSQSRKLAIEVSIKKDVMRLQIIVEQGWGLIGVDKDKSQTYLLDNADTHLPYE